MHLKLIILQDSYCFLHDVISAKSNLFIFIYSFLKKERSTKVSEII